MLGSNPLTVDSSDFIMGFHQNILDRRCKLFSKIGRFLVKLPAKNLRKIIYTRVPTRDLWWLLNTFVLLIGPYKN